MSPLSSTPEAVAATAAGASGEDPAQRGAQVQGEPGAIEWVGVEEGAGNNALDLFIGGAIEDGHADGYGIGLDYERRLSEDWGVGVFVQRVDGSERSLAAGAQLYCRLLHELVLIGGIGGERADGEWTPIGRLGARHEIDLGGGSFLAPEAFYDFGDDVDVLVYGVGVGYCW